MLSGVGVFGSRVNFKFGQQPLSQSVFGNHPFDGVSDDSVGVLGPQVFNGSAFLAASPAGVGGVNLLFVFVSGQFDFFSVHDDDEVSGVQMRRKNGFVFPAQNVGDFGCQAAENEAVGVNDVPHAFLNVNFWQMCFHEHFRKQKAQLK